VVRPLLVLRLPPVVRLLPALHLALGPHRARRY
jgi:hypothetical protein